MKRLKKLTAVLATSIALLVVAPLGVNAEWRQDNSGWWYSQGNSYATNWTQIDGQWYYFDSNGYMKIGWVNDSGNWYYFYGDGTMARNTIIDGYNINGSGNISSVEESTNQSAIFGCH